MEKTESEGLKNAKIKVTLTVGHNSENFWIKKPANFDTRGRD